VVGAIETVLSALNQKGVRYLVVGGVAVVLHGYLRTTADLDLVVELTDENALRAVQTLAGLGYRPRAPVSVEAFADPKSRTSWVKDKGMTVFSLWSAAWPTLEVDLFVEEPFDFEEVYARSLLVDLDTTQARVVALNDLVALKQAANRPRDIEDIAALRALDAPHGSNDDG
jgi:predicted nucleotidyltransferase